jgi:putative transcriptional regulator
METTDQKEGYLTGQLLIAMPGMADPRFARSVIYMCAHSEDGAMGLVINRELDSLKFADLLEQLGVDDNRADRPVPIHFGGPVETGRGFVLHSADYNQDGTLVVSDETALTATVDILRAIADGAGPRHRFLALGYAGWAPGQLESEIQANGWLCVEADAGLLFDNDPDEKWSRAMAKLGIDAHMLSTDSGRA